MKWNFQHGINRWFETERDGITISKLTNNSWIRCKKNEKKGIYNLQCFIVNFLILYMWKTLQIFAWTSPSSIPELFYFFFSRSNLMIVCSLIGWSSKLLLAHFSYICITSLRVTSNLYIFHRGYFKFLIFLLSICIILVCYFQFLWFLGDGRLIDFKCTI